MIIVLFLFALVLIYLFGTRNFNYWKEKGVKHDKPILFFGTYTKNYLLQQNGTEMIVDTYCKYPEEKVVGMYRTTSPDLLLRDPNLIKDVMTTDFMYFYSRGLNPHKEYLEPLMKNLFFADGDLWRLLRQRMTLVFTSGKIRAMFPLIVDRAEKLQAQTLKIAARGCSVDARDLMARYVTDIIVACGFGLDIDSLDDEQAVFRKLGLKIFDINLRDAIVIYLKDLVPGLFKNFKQLGSTEKEMTALVKSILNERKYKPSGRNDFIDLLIECRNKGVLRGDSIENTKPDGSPEEASVVLDDLLMTAQLFVFFSAGFETSSATTSYALHQLAYHPEIQKKVQLEIDNILAKHNNKLSYDAVKEMKYLEWTFKEGMRMFPPLGFVTRRCEKRYKFRDMDLTIDPGVRIIVPLQALHNDPKYYADPDQFRPERFDPNVFDNSLKHVYMPFGAGPRQCIGERLALMQSLAGLAAVLSRVSVRPAPESVRRPRMWPPAQIVQVIQGGLPLLFEKRVAGTTKENGELKV